MYHAFSEAERARLAPYVTDLDAPVFGLRNLPETVKGALFARYSRSEKGVRQLLLEEFLQNSASSLEAWSERQGGYAAQADEARAEDFYERVLIEYGDDSVAELGGAHIACEAISNVAAKVIEDSRIGISPLEKSTRYVRFDQKIGGQYQYLREPTIMASRHAQAYVAAMDELFDTYTALFPAILDYVRRRSPRDPAVSERAYHRATRAKALDLLRGLLPMATLTNVGLFGNGRAFEHLLNRLYASDLAELRTLAEAMQRALDALIPAFVKRPKTTRGQALQHYLRQTRRAVSRCVADLNLPPSAPTTPQIGVTLVDYDPDAEERVIAAILYSETHLPLKELRAMAGALDAEARAAIVRAYVGQRDSRFQRPGRAFEEARYTFDLIADLGSYRDLQRHRMLTQERQRYTTALGFHVPPEIDDAGMGARYRQALARAAEVATAIAAESPELAGYAVPFAALTRWRVTLNLREAYHLCELRSSPQGHPGYRVIAQGMAQAIREVHPLLAEGMRFVDYARYDLERLAAEQRLDQKLAAGRPDR